MRSLLGPKWALCAFVAVGACVPALAQSEPKPSSTVGNSYVSQTMPDVYQRWLDEDVRWIINSQEQKAFQKLADNRERDHFIEQFWLRRDPTPGTTENEFKEEHYRRIAYSNVHFAAQARGQLTDRGRIYVVYGPPDAIQKAAIDGVPEEIWRYNAFSAPGRFVGFDAEFPSNGRKVDLEFLDDCRCNDYRLTTPEPK